MTPSKRFGFLVAPLALAAFAVFINVNSAPSWQSLAAWQLYWVIKEAN